MRLMTIGFAIMMRFAAIASILSSVSLLKGHCSAMHGRTFERTSDKEGFAKTLSRPILAARTGNALSGAARRRALNGVVIPLAILAGVNYEITRIDTFEGYKEDLVLYCKVKE